MGIHAKFSPSGAHRWITCPGSIRLSESITDRPSEYALEGTALHKVTEHCLRDKMDADQFVGMLMEDPDSDWKMEFDLDHADAVQYCIDEVKRLTGEIGATGGQLELRVNLTEDCFGTVDVLVFSPLVGVVIDFKYGRGKSVEAEGNPQLMIYGLGAMKYMADQGKTPPKTVKLVILQPRIPNPTREWDVPFEDLKTWYVKSVKPAFETAGAMNAPCNPGQDQCQFCPANGVCTARANNLIGVAQEEFQQYAVMDDTSKVLVPMPDVSKGVAAIKAKMDMGLELLTPETAGKILAYQEDFDNFFKRVGEFALNTALDGKEVEGFKLVRGRSNRQWKGSEQEVIDGLTDLISLDDMYKEKLVSPAQAEKLLGKKQKGEIADMIVKPLGKLTLVDEADSRQAEDISGEADMEEFAKTEETATDSSPEDTNVFDDSASIDDIMSEFETPDEPPERKEEILEGKEASPPSKRTKKYQLMIMGLKGGVPMQEAADTLFKGDVGQVDRGLRNLNERDGYTIMLHSNNSFTVKE